MTGRVAGAAVGRQPAQGRHRPAGVRAGAEERQFLLVRPAEVARDAGRQVGGIEADEEGAPLCRISGEVPQELQGAVPYGAEMGCDHALAPGCVHARAEAESFPQHQYRPVPADGLQCLQGRAGCRREQGEHGLLGVRMAKLTDRGQEGPRRGDARQQPCDRLPDRELPRPLPGQGDQQVEPPRPPGILRVRVHQRPEHHLSAGEEDRRDLPGRNRMVCEGQADDRRGVQVVRKVPPPVQPAQAAHRGTAEQQGVLRGDGRQFTDVTAVRQVSEQFHPLPAQDRWQFRIADDLPQQAGVPVAGGGHEGRVGNFGSLNRRAAWARKGTGVPSGPGPSSPRAGRVLPGRP